MQLIADTREHLSEWKRISKQFDELGITYFRSKLLCGDYQSLDNARLVVDRKQNLTELCSNVCQDHERFRNEITRAQAAGIKIIFLCEHGNGVESLEDVIFWENPRRIKRKKVGTEWRWVETKATTGRVLYNILTTIRDKYGVDFVFCNKEETGRKIVELLGGSDGSI